MKPKSGIYEYRGQYSCRDRSISVCSLNDTLKFIHVSQPSFFENLTVELGRSLDPLANETFTVNQINPLTIT